MSSLGGAGWGQRGLHSFKCLHKGLLKAACIQPLPAPSFSARTRTRLTHPVTQHFTPSGGHGFHRDRFPQGIGQVLGLVTLPTWYHATSLAPVPAAVSLVLGWGATVGNGVHEPSPGPGCSVAVLASLYVPTALQQQRQPL